ncbi:MAG: hypothetical protein IPH84_12375 [Bacteroidales bacterium]|nr:hypothetical protein [Bacteroidales bacterium]
MEALLQKTVNRPAAITRAAAHPVAGRRILPATNLHVVRSTENNIRDHREESQPRSRPSVITSRHSAREAIPNSNSTGNQNREETSFQSPYLRRYEESGIFRNREQQETAPPAESDHGIESPITTPVTRQNETATAGERNLIPLPGSVNTRESSTENQAGTSEAVHAPAQQAAEATSVSQPAPASGPALSPAQIAAIHESEHIRTDSLQTETRTHQVAESRKQVTRETLGGSRREISGYFNSNRQMLEQTISNGRESVTSLFTMVVSAITNGSSAIFNMANALLAGLQTGILSLFVNLTVTAATFINQITTQITQILHSIPVPNIPGISEIRSLITGMLHSAARLITTFMLAAFSLLQRAVQNIIARVRNFMNQLFSLVSRFLAHVISTVTRMLTNAMNMMDQAWNFVVLRISQVLDRLVYPVVDLLETRIIQAIETGKQRTLNLIRMNRTLYLMALSQVIHPDRRNPLPEREKSKDPIGEIRQLGRDASRNNRLIITTFEMVTGGIINMILGFITTEASRIGLEVMSLIIRISGFIQQMIQTVINSFMIIFNIINIYIQSLFAHLTTVMEKAISFFFSLSRNVIDGLSNFTRSAFGRIRNVVAGVIQALFRFIRGSVSGIIEAVGAFNPNVTRAEMPDAPVVNAINHAYPRSITTVFTTLTRVVSAFSRVIGIIIPLALSLLLITVLQFIQRVMMALAALLIIPLVSALMRLLLIILRPGKTPVAPPAPQPEYAPGTGITVDYSVPLVNSDIQASEGEKMIFGVEGADTDRRKGRTPSAGGSPTAPAWTNIPGTGPYETRYQVSGDAEFNSSGSRLQQLVFSSLETRNTYLFIKGNWDKKRITVTATLKDKAPATAAPASGSTRDRDKVIRWTILPRKNPAPTGLKRVQGPGSAFSPAPVSYGYEATPPLPPRRPSYLNQTVLESFSNTRALFFTMADLRPEWKAAHASLDTPDKVAIHLYGTSNNGTFVFDHHDRIYDRHSGFGDTSPFTDAALARSSGIGYSKRQVYSCGGRSVGTALIERRINDASGIQVRKTGP